jgi:hypothetical protein
MTCRWELRNSDRSKRERSPCLRRPLRTRSKLRKMPKSSSVRWMTRKVVPLNNQDRNSSWCKKKSRNYRCKFLIKIKNLMSSEIVLSSIRAKVRGSRKQFNRSDNWPEALLWGLRARKLAPKLRKIIIRSQFYHIWS